MTTQDGYDWPNNVADERWPAGSPRRERRRCPGCTMCGPASAERCSRAMLLDGVAQPMTPYWREQLTETVRDEQGRTWVYPPLPLHNPRIRLT